MIEIKEKQYNIACYYYIGHDFRIIAHRKYETWYTPISQYPWTTFSSPVPNELLDDCYRYYITTVDGFRTITDRGSYSNDTRNILSRQTKEVILWERFQTFTNYYTRHFVSTPFEMKRDVSLLDEVKTYKRTGEVGNMLSLYKQLETSLSFDDIAERELLRIEDFKSISCYIRSIEYTIIQLLNSEKLEEANTFLNLEMSKTPWDTSEKWIR